MAKLVEYPPPPSPERTLEERWYDGGHFCFEEFTYSELSVSGFDDLVFDDELEDDKCDEVYRTGSELQHLVLRAFEHRVSGAFRMLWLDDTEWPDEVRETALLRFPRKAALEVEDIFVLADAACERFERENLTYVLVECVAMLHAYTGLPTGDLSPADRAAQESILRGGVAGEAVARIMRGPWLAPRVTSRGKSK